LEKVDLEELTTILEADGAVIDDLDTYFN